VYCTNDHTSWSWCSNFDHFSWICFEGMRTNVFRIHHLCHTIVSYNSFFIIQLTFPYNWSWKTSLLLGGLLSATDPVAVVALLKDLGASKKLSTIIEGESLMNDGYFGLDPLALIFSNIYHSSELLNLLINPGHRKYHNDLKLNIRMSAAFLHVMVLLDVFYFPFRKLNLYPFPGRLSWFIPYSIGWFLERPSTGLP